MGIDGLDLKYRLENRLGIRFEQAELFIAFHTVDTLYRCLVAKVRGGQQHVPDIETLWLEVSRDVSRLAGWWRLTTSDDLNKRFRPATRAENWRALELALGVALPALEPTPDQSTVQIPQACADLMGLTFWIAEHHPERARWLPLNCQRTGKMAQRAWTDAEIWEIMTECLCAVLGIKPEAVTADARLVEDLGMS